MRLLIAVIVSATLCSQAFAQRIQNGKGQFNGSGYKYFYLRPSSEIKGVVILIAGTGEQPQSVFNKTTLPQLLAENGFVTIIPEVHNLLYADDYSINVLNGILNMVVENFGTSNVVLGGFSSGGAIATKYSEHLLSMHSAVNLKGLFVIDPALDLERLCAAAERLAKSCDGLIKRQGLVVKEQLEKAFGGAPENRRQQYRNNSSFTAALADGGNAAVLKNLPIRLYSEPDLNFVRNTYCNELIFEDLNAFDLNGLHEFLLKAGNTRCEYIKTQGKGFHSWNIVDAFNCAEWIKGVMQ